MRRPALTLLVLVAAVLTLLVLRSVDSGDDAPRTPQASPSSAAPTSHAPTSPAPTIPSGLPAEVATTLRLADRGGPFPYRRDGIVFQNRESRLPAHQRGYWREYTVPTPGTDDRGARRLVVGRGGEAYYTPDHYRTFRQVRGARDRS